MKPYYPLILAYPAFFVLGYLTNAYVENWLKRHRILMQPTINDIKKNIEERNSVSEYDTDSNTSPNQN